MEDNNKQHIVWHDDVIIKQFISYAVGCMMGRYSIDKPGLILANQGDGVKEYEALVPNSRFEIDDDGIIPLMASNSDFADRTAPSTGCSARRRVRSSALLTCIA